SVGLASWRLSLGFPMVEKNPYFYAIASGNFEMVQWLRSVGVSEEKDKMCLYCIYQNKLDLLKIFLSEGYLLEANSVDKAISLGKTEIVKWLVTNLFAPDQRMFYMALMSGKYDIAKWLHLKKCPST